MLDHFALFRHQPLDPSWCSPVLSPCKELCILGLTLSSSKLKYFIFQSCARQLSWKWLQLHFFPQSVWTIHAESFFKSLDKRPPRLAWRLKSWYFRILAPSWDGSQKCDCHHTVLLVRFGSHWSHRWTFRGFAPWNLSALGLLLVRDLANHCL